MGKCVVGYLLVMGSEGDMGTHHYDDICRAAASYSVDRHEPSATIPYIYMLVSLSVVVMTYFGVNYLMPGMHSYS